MGILRDLKQENESGDHTVQRSLKLKVVGLKAAAPVQELMGPGPCRYLPACFLMPPGPQAAAITRLPATLNVLGIFMPPCFCTHRYCFLECSSSTSNCPTLTHPPRSTHLYYPFSMKSTPQLYPTLEPFHGSEGLPVSGWEFSNFVCLESRGIMRMFRTEK